MTVASTNLSLLYELALAFPEGLDRQGTFCLDQRAGAKPSRMYDAMPA